jgi:transposase-like protein
MTKQDVTTSTENKTQSVLLDDSGFLAAIVKNAIQEILEQEISEHLRAKPYERSSERTGVRNGYKPRKLKTRVGTIELEVPQTRDGSFSTVVWNRYQRSEKAFCLALMEMYVEGVSTAKVKKITETLCGTSFSKQTVSKLATRLDEQVKAWKATDLSVYKWPYIFVDALYEHIRVEDMVESVGVLIVCGVRSDGKRQILDVVCADTESESTYNELFCRLRKRGLSGVKMVISDAHRGLRNSISRYFEGASWQRCQVHFERDLLGKVSRKKKSELADDLKLIFNQPDKIQAMKKAAEASLKWQNKNQSVSEMLDLDIEQCLNFYGMPKSHWKRIRTNNLMERLNEEIRRRDRVVRIFPNKKSAERLICAICIEKSEEWAYGNVYLNMKDVKWHSGELKTNPNHRIKQVA